LVADDIYSNQPGGRDAKNDFLSRRSARFSTAMRRSSMSRACGYSRRGSGPNCAVRSNSNQPMLHRSSIATDTVQRSQRRDPRAVVPRIALASCRHQILCGLTLPLGAVWHATVGRRSVLRRRGRPITRSLILNGLCAAGPLSLGRQRGEKQHDDDDRFHFGARRVSQCPPEWAWCCCAMSAQAHIR
jgi:hypothetical protein